MFRFLRTFALFFVAFLSFDGGAFAGSFTCNSAKTYVSCNAGYYLSDCGSYRDGRAIASPAAGNSCRACPAATSSAYYECTGGAVCPKNMVENEFTIKTTSLAANTVFSFKISAAGVFYVKWGDSSVVQKIDRTNDTAETSYSHTYTTSGVKTITISGQATAYTTSVSIPAINFYNNKNIASISGSLGAVFGTLSNGTQPRFFQSFYGATNLAGAIPSTLFNGITGTPVSHMFAGTFQNCSKLTSIGTGLFSGLSGSAAASLFQSTFNGCTGLTSIPENLFSGISGGVGSSAFDHTFNGCTGLTSIPENLFGNIPSTATLGSYAFRNMFNGCTNLSGPSAKINGEFIYDIWPSATTTQVGGMYTGATGLADWPCIPTNYGGESNGCIYISYNANGGSGTAPTSPTYCVIGGTCVVPSNTFTKTGYNFSYWTASVDGSSLVESIAPGTDIFSGYSESELKGWKSVELTANWSVKCNKITLNNTTNGGSGGTTTVYKKTGSTTYYSDSSCSTAITSVTVPSKANASYLGHFLTSTNSANTGTRCISSAGVLSTSTSCNVSADTTWYAHYQCADGWTDSGEYATGVCGKNITITLDNAYATTDGTDILYGRTGISYPFLDSAFTKRLTPTANPITIPVNQSVFTFNTNGGSVDLSGSTFSPSATVSGNVATFAPSTFMGYYSATSGGTQYVDRNGYITLDGILAVASATGDLTWYAQWNPSLVTITNVPRAVREGFDFSSWTVEFDNRGHMMTGTASVGQRISLPASATFTANYTPITYAVTLDTQGGTGGTSGFYYKFKTSGQCMYYSSADLSACTDGASGTTLTIPTRTGYTFDGYYTAENGGGVMYVDALGTISPDLLAVPENTTLYAKWTPNCNPVYLNPTSGTAGDLWTVYKITDFPDIWFTDPMCSVRIDQAAIEALVPTRSGYTFRGFYAREDSAEYESDIVADYKTRVPYLLSYGYASPIWNVNGRTSLYASWVKDCEVPANGSCRMSIGSDGLTVDYTATCNTGYTVGNADTSTPTCTANTYTVSYAANRGSGSAPTAPTSCTYGSDCTAPANTYTRTGYTFAGWKCTGGTTACDGDIIAAGSSLKNVSTGSAITLTAQWTANTYTVSFNANGGTGGQSASVTATYAAAMPEISTTAPTRDGYTFVGWYDNADYAAGVQYYTADGASARNWNKTENTTLYAGWTINGYDCKAGEYLNVTACKVCESGYYCPSTAVSYSYNGQIQGRTACPSGYGNSATGSVAQTACYLMTEAGKYVATAQGALTDCPAGDYCTGGVKVNYGSIGGGTPCPDGYRNGAAGYSAESQCLMTVLAGKYVGTENSSTLSTCAAGTYKGAHTVAYGSTSSCDVCGANQYSDAGAGACSACATDKGYSNSGDAAENHAGVESCKTMCEPGAWVATAGGGCEDVGAGYYGAGGTVPQGRISENRGQCVAPLTTIGYGFGANEADDCGRKLHAGSEVIYLRSAPRTSPALNVRVGDDIFYGAMSTALTSKLKVKDVDNITYSVVNDYQ